MTRLDIPFVRVATFYYPNAIKHEGALFITFSRLKNTSELIKVTLDAVNRVRNSR